ncbi:MAG: polysaccharide biosynthesis tyrosine autokinase [Burkholderiales bacterium]|nr:MAG: polysaccharide biosynthesis tyrosine autokinase [Burkholderiales bacterium]
MTAAQVSGNALARSRDSYMDLGAAVAAVWRHRWVVVAITLVVTALGAGYAVLAPPVYQSNLLLKVDVSDAATKSIPPSLAGIFELKTASTAELELLRSRAVVSAAVESSKLYIEAAPKRLPVIGPFLARRSSALSEPGLLGYGGYVWGRERIDVPLFEVPASLEKKTFTVTFRGGSAYRLQLDGLVGANGVLGEDLIVPLEGTEPLRLRIGAIGARPGAQFVLRRIPDEDAVEQLQKALVIAERNKASGVISVSLNSPEPATAARVLNAIAAQYLRQNVDLRSEEAERSLAFLEAQLPELKAAIETAESKYNSFRNSKGTVDTGEEVKSILQQSLQSQLRLVELRQKRDELTTRYQDENPLVVAVNQQIRTVTAELASVNDRIKKIPGTEQDAVRLTRDVKVNTELYSALLATAQQLRLVRASGLGSAKLVDRAVAPRTPIGPNRPMLAAAAAAFGLLAGIVTALIRNRRVNAIENPYELVEVLSLPLGAVVPHSARQARIGAVTKGPYSGLEMLVNESSEEGAVESLRTLRAALPFHMLGSRNNVIAIVGPTAAVGKSFVASNLSALLASSGKKVLLIDADLRAGYLHDYFNRERGEGLYELVMGERRPEEVLARNVFRNLDFISTGGMRPRPADALANGMLGPLLERLRSQYDYVVVDTAPVLAVADALIVSHHAGIAFCVARRGVTTYGQLSETKARFEANGHALTGVIFNDARLSDVSYGAAYRRIPVQMASASPRGR